MTVDSVIIHDIRSSHNVGAILRTCDGFGVKKVYIGGLSPYPKITNATRLPHIIAKLTKDISKTALGAEQSVEIIPYSDINNCIADRHSEGLKVVALEQAENSTYLHEVPDFGGISLIIGREVEGIDPEILNKCDAIVEIPMYGSKESFNVSVACGIALYALCNNRVRTI